MARSAIVKVGFRKDETVKKSMTPKEPLAGRDGEFVWIVSNHTISKLVVSLENFKPSNYLEFDTSHSVDVPPNKKGVIVATVVDAEKENVKVTYEIYLDGKAFDPDLIIEGDGNIRPKRKQQKKKEKGRARKGAKKR